jgi:hypothetical protein
MKIYSLRALLIILIFCSFPGVAQTVPDTSFVTIAARNGMKTYERYVQGQTGLYVGSEYLQPPSDNVHHPFYVRNEWQWGDVEYNGELYENVPLLYDLSTDDLVTEQFYNGDEMVLVKAKVGRFSIEDHNFTNITAEQANMNVPLGFYRINYDGPTRIISHHIKTYGEKIENNQVKHYYTPKSRYYILKDGKYEKVATKADILKVLQDKKSELRAYIRKKKIEISKTSTAAIAELAKFYDTLTIQK